ncbi:MAG: SPOR domain-containing protein [Cyanobacteria bacterium J06638_28]
MSSSVAPEQVNAALRPKPSSQPIEDAQSVSLLSGVLSNLSVQLDYELARYRYATKGIGKPRSSMSSQLPLQPRPQSLQLFQGADAKPASSDQTQTVAPPPVPKNPRLQVDPSVANGSVTDTSSNDGPAAEVAALRSALVRQSQNTEATELDTEATYLASSEALLESLGNAAYAETTPLAPPASESRGWTKHLNTPLGLGAFLLLLVASAGFGFVLVNPVAVQHLVEQTPLARFWPGTVEDESELGTDSSPDAPDGVATSTQTPLNPLSPNLAEKEFTNLDLYSLSNLPPTAGLQETAAESERAQTDESDDQQDNDAIPTAQAPAGIPQRATTIPRREAVTQPVAPSSSSAPTAPRPSSPSSSGASASPSTPPPSQSSATSTPAAVSPPPTRTPSSEGASPVEAATNVPAASSSSTSYHVVSDYTGDPSLATARESVPDAYVHNFDIGARIQLGAFESEAGANALIEELQEQGIDASLHTVGNE